MNTMRTTRFLTATALVAATYVITGCGVEVDAPPQQIGGAGTTTDGGKGPATGEHKQPIDFMP